MFLLGWFFSLSKQRMNSGPMTLNTFPSLLRHSPSNGREASETDSRKRSGKNEFFSDARSACIAHRPRDIQLPKFWVKEGTSHFRFFWNVRDWEGKLINLFMYHGSPAAMIYAFFKRYFSFSALVTSCSLVSSDNDKSGGVVCSVEFWSIRSDWCFHRNGECCVRPGESATERKPSSQFPAMAHHGCIGGNIRRA